MLCNVAQETKQSDKNSINFIRLLAALQVFFGHAQVHLNAKLLPGIVSDLFSLVQGVPVFFILSGFLIWDSIQRTKSLGAFCKKRVLRLYPELWTGVALNFILIILLFGKNISWIPYIAFQLTQSTFMQFWTPDCLRAYGCGTPNGSLWTICVTLQAYFVMWFLHKCLGGKKFYIWLAVNVVAISLSFTPLLAQKMLPTILAKLYDATFVPYIWLFIIGMTLSEFFGKAIIYLKRFWYIFALLAVVVLFLNFDVAGKYKVLKSVLVALAMIGFAYRINRINVKFDYSYGLYIYHMIVINAMIHVGLVGEWWHIILALLISSALAVLSYHTIGLLSRKKRKDLAK